MEVPTGSLFGREFHWSELWRQRVTWRGVACWQCPLDLWSYQQIIFATRPQAIVECGIAAGGTTLFVADLLDILGDGFVHGVDKDLASLDVRVAGHPRVRTIAGDSVDPCVIEQIRDSVRGLRTMVVLDSAHESEHVLAELRAYAGVVSPGCYLVCEDAILDRPDIPSISGYSGPFHAIQQFLAERTDFIADDACVLGATFNPGGYLRRLI
jgi:cephalosporin hydroxylase